MPAPDLRGLGVLVTRPAHQAEGLCNLIVEAGGRAIRFPVLAITPPNDEAAARASVARLADYDLLVFVSPNAVQYGLDLIEAQSGLPAGLTLAVVGAGSARALYARLGREPDLQPPDRYETEGLLAMPELQTMAGKRVLILRGNGGRALLGQSLRERGATVDYVEVYRRECPRVDADLLSGYLQADEVDMLTVTSSEGLHNLLTLAGAENTARLQQLPLAVVSERTAALARELGFTAPILTAAPASDAGLIEAIGCWAGEYR
ncbi:MAG: uroporphyrinogen-III synthase [Thiohalomonadaceae bacterium]